ncbi:adenosylhomocysteinase [Curtobacterium sp. MCBD17_032]|uniref:adenosylhomocysteinase n=1 Tax=Curtobacterium sp. MCBD17_032 TaxID=2175659 RepID=UPI000DAA3484|nr:adenosylhomocysteinase [Curtobacterium sp. MCBD17_032]PZE81720.1 adenosylhomocysteinase [Curtobacterium sp. MCBD17_032]
MPRADPTRADAATLAWASAAVRHTARVTNMLLAARRFRIVGGDPRDTAALHAMLVGLGSRPADTDVHAAVDQLWCLGTPEQSSAAVEAATAGRLRGAMLLVVDAGRHVPAVDEDAFGPTTPARPGVLAVPTLSDDVFLVSTGREPEDDPAAEARIRWARRSMPMSRAVADELRRGGLLRGTRVGVSLFLEPKTAVLSLLLQDAGAEVVGYAHADETDDAVAAVLRRVGVPVHASSTATVAEQRALALAMLDTRPHVLVDDGSHVIRLVHQERPDLLPTMLGAAEETTSGLRPLRVMAARGQLGIPVVAVNDARTKTFFDNRYGTGQSAVFATLDLVDALDPGVRPDLTGGSAVVAGFGHVGEGVALVLRALGFRVTVADTDPVRALQAVFAGYAVAPLVEAVRTADLVLSATGVPDTISLTVLRACAPGAVLSVAGGVDQEIAVEGADAAGAERATVGRRVERLTLPDGPAVLLLDGGGCINITAAEGNPIEVMDLSFAAQLGAVRMLVERGDELDRAVVPIDPEVDEATARVALAAFGALAGPPGGGADADGTSAATLAAQPADREPDVRTRRFGDPS